MKKYSSIKNTAIIFIILVSILYAVPNIFGSDLAVQLSKNTDELITKSDIGKVKRVLNNGNIPIKSIGLNNNKILVRFNDNTSQLLARDILKQKLSNNYIVALNLAPSIPKWLSILGAKAISLGLDLRGGVHFLIEVDMDTVISTATDKYLRELRTLLRSDRLYKSIKKEGTNIIVQLKDAKSRNKVVDLINSEFTDLIVTIDDKNDKLLTVSISNDAQKDLKRNVLKQNIITLKNRVNELGVAEPVVQQQGLSRILVQLPGVQDTTTAIDILGTAATLEFRLVDEQADPRTTVRTGKNPIGSKLYYFKDGTPLLLKNRIIASGDNIIGASSGLDQEGSGPIVNISLDSVGGRSMLETTKKYLNNRMAVVFIENKIETVLVNGKEIKKRSITKEIINAATIQGTFSSRFRITGLDSLNEASNLALLLRAGSLSAPIEIIEERTVGPSLGSDNIKKGVMSVVAGFILVLLFMVFRYKVFGLIANIALTVNLIIIVSVLSLLQATLTLPGIAGIVLTVGMAVDANVLIFERIKEELKVNNNLQQAIINGYDKAIITISDANITTLIAALVLFSFGTGPIKGFAVTLSIGIIASMFTAIVLSRAIIDKIYIGKRAKRLSI